MFEDAISFNKNINNWNVLGATDMSFMFSGATSFKGDISGWNTISVNDMSSMFSNAISFNGDIRGWNTISVNNMSEMFSGAVTFNKDISDWSTISVTNMSSMFSNAISFNQDISGWNTINVPTMNSMFSGATSFNQDIGEWNIIGVTDMGNMFDNSGLSTTNYDALLIDWSEQNVKPNVLFGAVNLTYCTGEDARQNLIDNKGWLFTGDELACSTASVDEQNQLNITIYPNPTSDIVYIEGNYSQLKTVVYDILGKQVMNKSITNSIDISHLDNGVYILQLSDGVKLSTRKIIKN
jgi:surface protein